MRFIPEGPLRVGTPLTLAAVLVGLVVQGALAQPAIVPSCSQEAQLIGIGEFGSAGQTYLTEVSGDGTVAVGLGRTTFNGPTTKALIFELDGSGGMRSELPGLADSFAAHGVSGDGSTVVGLKVDNSHWFPVRWVDGGQPEELGFLEPTIAFSSAVGVSDGGEIVAGNERVFTPNGQTLKPFRWSRDGGLQQLPTLDPNGFGQAEAISPDGRWVVGRVQTSPAGLPVGTLAAIWDNGRLATLPLPQGSECTIDGTAVARTEARDVSADGRTVVGSDLCAPIGVSQGLIWSPDGLLRIEPLAGDDVIRLEGVSQDGTIVVGTSFLTGVSSTAILWTANQGTRSLLEILELDHQVDVSSFAELSSAYAVAQAPFGTVVVGDGTRGGPTREGFVAILPCADDDRDGLCNNWEEMEGIDLNGDGDIEVGTDVLLPGADPEHMNLYVEVDFVGPSVGTEPFVAVEQAFADVPAALVANPNGKPGILLFTELSDDGLTLAGGSTSYTYPPGSSCPLGAEFATRKSEFFGDVEERSNADLIAVKERIYRYAIFGGAQPDGTAGIAEAYGNDFIVTLEGFEGLPSGTPEQQASTFMHELGHTLGLAHGGPGAFDTPATDNFEPNYHSVMNYLWSLPGRGGSSLANLAFDQSWVLDYSREMLPPLDETALIETAGLGGNPLYTVPIGPPPGRFVNEALATDFDGDLQIEMPPVGSAMNPIDLNRPTTNVAASPGTGLLEGGNDWSFIAATLCHSYRNNLWGEGVHSCTDGELGESQVEITEAVLDDLRAIDFIDCNGNGVLDDTDLLGGATDVNANGLLDECEPLPGDLDGDEDVDLDDRTLFADSFGSGESEPEYLPAADFDADRTVSLPDYAFWVEAFFGAMPLAVEAALVVELRMEPALVAVDPDDTFELRIESTLPGGTLGFGLDLAFDDKVLEVVGDPVVDPAWTSVFARDLDGLAGLAPTTGLAGPQRMATLTLRAVGAGTTEVVPSITLVDETEGVVLDGGAFAAATSAGAMVTVVPEAAGLRAAAAALSVLAAHSVRRRKQRA